MKQNFAFSKSTKPKLLSLRLKLKPKKCRNKWKKWNACSAKLKKPKKLLKPQKAQALNNIYLLHAPKAAFGRFFFIQTIFNYSDCLM